MPVTNAASGFKPGDIDHKPMTSAPAGWLKANGATVSRDTYAALFAAIGTTFNTGGEAATDFRLPDLRGEFIRGLDDGRGVDSTRAIGSAQSDQNKAHQHNSTEQLGVADGVVLSSSAGSNYRVPWGNPSGTPQIMTSSQGGTEARPRNVALLACIKF